MGPPPGVRWSVPAGGDYSGARWAPAAAATDGGAGAAPQRHRGGLHPRPTRRPRDLPRLACARGVRRSRDPRGGQRAIERGEPSCWSSSGGGRVRYVREPRPGLDWARNRAIAEARGDVIAFTDDDVAVDPGWIRALVAAFGSDETVAAVTGLVLPAELETEAQVLFERYRSFSRGFVPRRIAAVGRGAGGAPLWRRRRLRDRREHGLPPLALRPPRRFRPGARRRHADARRATTWRCSFEC